MPPAKILIVEDEILIAETIKTYLNERGHIITEIAISYEEAIDAYQREQPDVILLDVRLYGKKSGIDVAEYLSEQSISTPYIYLTSQFDKRIVETAMTTKPQGYLTKPIQKETLWTTVELALFNAQNEEANKTLHINDGAESHILNTDEIVYISSNHVYINIHMKDESTHIIRNSISQILDELNPEIFMQSHRGYIINLNYVESYNKMHVIVAKEEIPISRSRRSEMKTKMENLKSQL